MNIETTHEVGEQVWTIKDSSIQRIMIRSVRITLKQGCEQPLFEYFAWDNFLHPLDIDRCFPSKKKLIEYETRYDKIMGTE